MSLYILPICIQFNTSQYSFNKVIEFCISSRNLNFVLTILDTIFYKFCLKCFFFWFTRRLKAEEFVIFLSYLTGKTPALFRPGRQVKSKTKQTNKQKQTDPRSRCINKIQDEFMCLNSVFHKIPISDQFTLKLSQIKLVRKPDSLVFDQNS